MDCLAALAHGRFWHFASFHSDAATQSLSERSGHRLSRALTEPDL
jgi:hypothetical protein